MCTEEGCERGPPAPAAPPAHRREGGGGTGEGGRRGWWHRVPVALVEVSPRPLQFGARTPGGPGPVPGAAARREPSAGLCHGDNLGTVAEHGAVSGAARQHLTFRRGSGRGGGGAGGATANNGPLFPASIPRPPLRCPRRPAPACPKAWPGSRGGRGSAGVVALGGPRVAPSRSCAAPRHGAGGRTGHRGSPFPKFGCCSPGRAQPAARPQGAWLGAGSGGAQSGCPGGCRHLGDTRGPRGCKAPAPARSPGFSPSVPPRAFVEHGGYFHLL